MQAQPLLNETAFDRRRVVAVYKDDGSRGHHMNDFIPAEEMAKFMAKCGDDQAAQVGGTLLHCVHSFVGSSTAVVHHAACASCQRVVCGAAIVLRPLLMDCCMHACHAMCPTTATQALQQQRS